MLNHKKIFRFFIYFSFILIISSCTKLADKNYTEIISDQFSPEPTDLVSLVGPAYGAWRDLIGYNGSSNFFRTQEVTADEIVIPARP